MAELYTVTIAAKRRRWLFGRTSDQETMIFEKSTPNNMDPAQFRTLCRELLAEVLDNNRSLRYAALSYDLLWHLSKTLAKHGFTKVEPVSCEIEVAKSREGAFNSKSWHIVI